MLPAPGRNAFLIGVTVPTVNPVGDPQFNRQQDQTNASRVSLGGGGIRANNYLLDGVPITELRGRAIANPTIEAIEEIKVQIHTYDAEMGRTGAGCSTSPRNQAATTTTAAASTRLGLWGQTINYFSEKEGGTKETTGVSDSLPVVWRRRRRSHLQKSHVLLGLHRRVSIVDNARTAAYLAHDSPAQRRLFADPRWWPAGAPVQPWCRSGAASAVPGHRHRVDRDWRRVHRRDDSAHTPRSTLPVPTS